MFYLIIAFQYKIYPQIFHEIAQIIFTVLNNIRSQCNIIKLTL